MTANLQRTLVFCSVGFILLGIPSFFMIGLIPPVSPMRTADEIARFWSTNTGVKRMGLVLLLASGGLFTGFGVMLVLRITQMAGGRLTILAYAELVATGAALVFAVIPVFPFAVASYRPERSPEITQALNDLGWMLFIMPYPAAVIQSLAVGFAILGAVRQVWPRWLGYFNLWSALLFAGGGLAVLFKDGVFAWNGLIAFWLPAALFGGYFSLMIWQMWVTIGVTGGDDAAEVQQGVRRSTP